MTRRPAGNVLLWQHLFWFFGHPDVYIIFLPAVGMVSQMVATFSRRPVVGYTFLALAAVATSIISFGVWVHHMFAVGLPPLTYSFFGAAIIDHHDPVGDPDLCLDRHDLVRTPTVRRPFSSSLASSSTLCIGGLSGVMFAVVPFDQQVTDSYFVVAHFHYVLIGGMVFPLFGAFYYWLPKITGRLLNEGLGQWNFWTIFVGFNLTFFPMHITGLLGMPRRYYTYLPGLGFELPNLLSTIGAFLLAVGVLIFIVNWMWSVNKGRPAGENPWQAGTLEWSMTSPPPAYNFRLIPLVRSSDPLWDGRSLAENSSMVDRRARHSHLRNVAGAQTVAEDVTPVSPYARQDEELRWLSDPYARETLTTTLLDAQPDTVLHIPEDSYWPAVMALGLSIVFVGVLLNGWILAGVGGLISLVALIGWLWPHAPHSEENYT